MKSQAAPPWGIPFKTLNNLGLLTVTSLFPSHALIPTLMLKFSNKEWICEVLGIPLLDTNKGRAPGWHAFSLFPRDFAMWPLSVPCTLQDLCLSNTYLFFPQSSLMDFLLMCILQSKQEPQEPVQPQHWLWLGRYLWGIPLSTSNIPRQQCHYWYAENDSKNLAYNKNEVLNNWSSSEVKMKVKVAQSCPTFCNIIDYTVHGILQARIME